MEYTFVTHVAVLDTLTGSQIVKLCEGYVEEYWG